MATVKNVLAHKGSEVVTIGSDETALAAAKLMNDRQIGALVVIENQEVIGIISERDISRRVVATGHNPETTKISEIMTAPIACCGPNANLKECQAIITERRIRHLPVMEEGRLCGMITIGDLLAEEIEEQNFTIKQLNDYVFLYPSAGC